MNTNTTTHHNRSQRTNNTRIVEKKVYVNRNSRGLPIGKAFGATVSTGAKLGGGLFNIAKKGYDMSQEKRHDPMSRDSAYGSKARYKDRGDNMQKIQLGFPNNETMKRMKKTGFSFMLLMLLLPAVMAAAPSMCNYVVGTSGEEEMLSCFIYFVYSVSIGMVIAHPLAILYVFIGIFVILVFLAFSALMAGAVSRSIDR